MKEIINKNGVVTKIFAETFEDEAYKQIEKICNYEPYLDSKIRIMPDAHAGKGCVIGTTIKIKDKVTPNLVGVDIGCNMYVAELSGIDPDLAKLDYFIRNNIPSGFNIRHEAIYHFSQLDGLYCLDHINKDRALRSIGTLGGGNHFIELNRGRNGNIFLVVHTGCRHLGVEVCKYYQDLAYKELSDKSTDVSSLINRLKSEGREKDIQNELKSLKRESVDKDLAYLDGVNFEKYLHDMMIVQYFATRNSEQIVLDILSGMKWRDKLEDCFYTRHNYIDVNNMILRKGAVSAKKGERLIIPMNMRDGSLICIGKGNPDWNYSAPHGAGRLMSRAKAKEQITMDSFKDSMNGIYTTSVCESTLDEAPQAYKPMEEIISAISDTVDIVDVIKPIYNFKAS